MITERPYIDAAFTHFEGYTDEEIAAVLELHAALLDRAGMNGVAADIRAGAARIRDLAEVE